MSTATDVLGSKAGAAPIRATGESIRNFESTGNALARFAPVHDWVSLIILSWMMANVGWSVQLAGWGDLPSIIPTLLMGMLAAFIVPKLNFKWYLVIVYAIGLGVLVVLWQGSAQATGGQPFARGADSVSRFIAWINVAREGGISTDTVPFASMFIAASWILAYSVTALTFKFKSPWMPTVLLSMVILTNLSYRHGEHEHTFFLFLVGGVALFAHLTTIRRIERWKSEGISYSKNLAWSTVQDGVLLAIPIVLIGALLPVWEPRSDQLKDTWEWFRSPFVALQEPANRLLAGVDGPGSNGLFSMPSQTMAFGGGVTLTQEPLLWVSSKYVVPHAGRIYQHYTSQGWLNDAATEVRAPARSALTPAPEELARERVSQIYIPLVDTRTVVPAGGVFSVDRNAIVQILDPIVWRVPLSSSAEPLISMPTDIREVGFAVRSAVNDLVPVDGIRTRSSGRRRLVTPDIANEIIERLKVVGDVGVDPTISTRVTDDAGVEQTFETVLEPFSGDAASMDWDVIETRLAIDEDSGLVTHIVIEREAPIEQISVLLAKEVKENEEFSIQTFVSTATDEQLDEAGVDYPTWVTDRYLQLPTSLPAEVWHLAEDIVSDAEAVTPFEKAEAVKKFLRSQEYSLEIAGPEHDTDGLYYFLFQTQDEPCASVDEDCHIEKVKGYSQYFGSAGAVLLRAVGVPARFIAGWGPGEYYPEAEQFLIRDADRHGWTQVYFPEYGWIDYEVTPGQASPDRGQLPFVISDGVGTPSGSLGMFEDDQAYLDDLDELERIAALLRARGLSNLGDDDAGSDLNIPWRALAWTGGVVAFIVIVSSAWWISLRGMDAPTKAYARMNRIAVLMGMRRRPNETVMEFAAILGDRSAGAREHASLIAIEYQKKVYSDSVGLRDNDGELPKRLERAWRGVARALLTRRLKQMTGLSGSSLSDRRF